MICRYWDMNWNLPGGKDRYQSYDHHLEINNISYDIFFLYFL